MSEMRLKQTNVCEVDWGRYPWGLRFGASGSRLAGFGSFVRHTRLQVLQPADAGCHPPYYRLPPRTSDANENFPHFPGLTRCTSDPCPIGRGTGDAFHIGIMCH